MWGTVVPVVLGLAVVAIIVALIMPDRKGKEPVAEQARIDARGESGAQEGAPSLAELSAGLQNALRTVGAACEKCERAKGDEFVAAWRGLHHALRTAIAGLDGLLGATPNPRTARMVRLTTEELWDIAERHLVAHVPATVDDMALLRRNLWDRATTARAAPERLRRMADQVDAAVDALGGGTEDDRHAAAELRRFVNQQV